jgi:DNA-binding response OmpR family regulator
MSRKKQNSMGMGMGLAIVKKILDSLDVPIHIDSTPGKGTRFNLTFQRYSVKQNDSITTHNSLIPVSIEHKELIIPEEMVYNPGKPTLLLVEDNRELLSFLIRKLQENYNIYYARDGRRALSRINEILDLDLIISDIMMDEMDGHSFRKKLDTRPEFSAIPFIFLTAHTRPESKLMGLQEGAVDYIVKPFSYEELQAKIDSLITLCRATRQEKIKTVREKINTRMRSIQMQSPGNHTKQRHNCQKNKISDQEIRVMSMLKEGLMYKEIAFKLNVSINSVRTYIKRIHTKLAVHTTKEMFNSIKDI